MRLRTHGGGLAAACAGLLAITLLGGSGAAASEVAAGDRAGTTGTVPEVLQPPAGNVPLGSFAAVGVQVYRCTGSAWTFVEPAATLAGVVGRRPHAAIHFRGPSWESIQDGSLVEARAVATSPVPGSIPELLLQATLNRGDGVFGRVSYLQRLRTSGGVAPAGACTDGQTTGVPYRAEYRFFVPAA